MFSTGIFFICRAFSVFFEDPKWFLNKNKIFFVYTSVFSSLVDIELRKKIRIKSNVLAVGSEIFRTGCLDTIVITYLFVFRWRISQVGIHCVWLVVCDGRACQPAVAGDSGQAAARDHHGYDSAWWVSEQKRFGMLSKFYCRLQYSFFLTQIKVFSVSTNSNLLMYSVQEGR